MIYDCQDVGEKAIMITRYTMEKEEEVMKINRWMKILAATLVLSLTFSMPVFGAEVDELTLTSSEQASQEEDLVEAGAHAAIYPDPTMYEAVFSNNTKIDLVFNVRTFGNEMERYEIRIFKGTTENSTNLVARKNADFDVVRGTSDITYSWDTTDYSRYTPGIYTISCTSFYNTNNGDAVNNKETFTVTLEDYRLILDRQFVQRLYEKVFQRSADETGLNNWSNKLYNGTTTGATTAWNFFFSPEFLNKNTSNEEYVDILYQALFDRDADASGKTNWVDLLNDGVSRAYVLKGFTDSEEFNHLCSAYGIQQGTITLTENRDKNPQVTAFVNRLYTISLDRSADTNGLNDWTGKLLSKTQTSKQVASGFVFSQEMTNRNLSNQEFVTMLYQTMMDREPDETGLNDWVTRLQQGTSRQSVFEGFADSTEFNNIVREYGLAE